MKRRHFLTLTAAAAAFPKVAFGQQPAKLPRVMVLVNGVKDDPVTLQRASLLETTLREYGWIKDSNLQIEYGYNATDPATFITYAANIAHSPPEVIFVDSGITLGFAATVTKTVPIVMVSGSDPVALGLVSNYARPDGNITGFPNGYSAATAKLLEMLLDLVPTIKNVGYLYAMETPDLHQPTIPPIQEAAAAHGVNLTVYPIYSEMDIELNRSGFAGGSNS